MHAEVLYSMYIQSTYGVCMVFEKKEKNNNIALIAILPDLICIKIKYVTVIAIITEPTKY